MLSIVLTSIATVASTFRRGKHRLLVCLSVLLPAIFHYALFNDSIDFEYYGTAAVASLIVIAVLEFLPRSPLVADIQLINLGYIFAHFAGFVLYHSYMEPLLYNALVLGIFVIEFTRLMITTTKDKKHGACGRFDSIHSNDHGSKLGGAG